MKKKSQTIIILCIILITLFTIAIVPKSFQNDTFFNISIGKYILNNGIDMQEHFSWIDGLKYTYSHWAFDICIYLIYNFYNFAGIYIVVIISSIIINITLFIFLTKKYNNSIISLIITILISYAIRNCYTARSQIVSFLFFIIEIYCIDRFIDTNKKIYAVVIIISSIVVANFHAATWPLFLVLFIPYLFSAFLNFISAKNIYRICRNFYEKKLKKTSPTSPKYEKYKDYFESYSKYVKEKEDNYKKIDKSFWKIIIKEKYNSKNLIILFFIVFLTGMLTPIGNTPYTYIIKSMFGYSNFDDASSMSYILEMQPLVPITNEAFILFSIIFFTFFIFMPTKLKLDQLFLIFGLYTMALLSVRYVYLLLFIGSYILCDLITQSINKFDINKSQFIQKIIVNPFIMIALIFSMSLFTINSILEKNKINYINEKLYPVYAVQYIKENIDYKKMKIYNAYDFGSYLMLNDIPVFIDSRLDVYCSEFNNTDIFYDFIQVLMGKVHYEKVFSKYQFTHILLQKNDIVYNYIQNDSNYKLLYDDDYFALYEKI